MNYYGSGYNSNYGGGGASFDGDESVESALRMLDNDPELSGLFQEASSRQQEGSRSVSVVNPNELADFHNQVYGAAETTGERGLLSGNGHVPFAWQAIAGAAGWQAMKWYTNKQKHSGHGGNHAFMKKAVAAVAMSQAVKLLGRFGVGDKRTRDEAARGAAANAMEMYDREVGSSNGGMMATSMTTNEPGMMGGGYGAPPAGNFNAPYGSGAPPQPAPYYNGPPSGGAYPPPQGMSMGGPPGYGEASSYHGGGAGGFYTPQSSRGPPPPGGAPGGFMMPPGGPSGGAFPGYNNGY
ncbi:hypothetical protein IWQ62_003400 [Dispira parvispora]|uniref:Uncharacterized protein n=1 Tax=Dispira parvispora TaxID=1520584 RepID=A0A9W8AU48_9FUNG|nr:hypothetical protein IWQ62_003400 [Dispira parvispora]